jgi:hypothetical protein
MLARSLGASVTRLVMTLLVRDEAALVRENIDYHLARGVDFVVATDNGSIDGTREILAEYERKGVLALIDEPRHDFMQDAWTTRMAHLARDRYGADWVLSSDADEFWWTDGGDLRAECVHADVVVVPRVDLLPTYEQTLDPSYRFFQNTLRQGRKARSLRPETTPKVIFRTEGLVSVEAGNHDVSLPGARRRTSERARIYHFPYRTFAEFDRKVENGGASLRRNDAWPASWGKHWREWYRAREDGRLQDVFRTLVPSEAEAHAEITRGRLFRDETLARVFAT